MSWISPDLVTDSSGFWFDDELAIDDDTDTFAYSSVDNNSWSQELTFIPPYDGEFGEDETSCIICNKIRFNAYRNMGNPYDIRRAKVRLFLETGGYIEKIWTTYGDHSWTEWDLEGTYYVNVALISFYNNGPGGKTAKLYEFDFGKAAARGKVNGSLATSILVNRGLT